MAITEKQKVVNAIISLVENSQLLDAKDIAEVLVISAGTALQAMDLDFAKVTGNTGTFKLTVAK